MYLLNSFLLLLVFLIDIDHCLNLYVFNQTISCFSDISENEELQTTPSRKMADGAEIARDEGEEDFCIEK